MFLKLHKSLKPNNTTYVMESLIWNTLIPSRHELPDDIVDSYGNGNKEENDDLSPIPINNLETY